MKKVFSDQNEMKLENNRRKFWDYSYVWKLKNTVLNNQWVNVEITGKLQIL